MEGSGAGGDTATPPAGVAEGTVGVPMFTIEVSCAGCAAWTLSLPPCGPTTTSAFALSSAEMPFLSVCGAELVLLVPESPFMFFAKSTPPATAAITSTNAAHLIQALLLFGGSGGKAGADVLVAPIGDRNGATGSEATFDGSGAGAALTGTKGSMIGAALLNCAVEVTGSAAAGTGAVATGACSWKVLISGGGVTGMAAASGAASSGADATTAAETSGAKGVPHLGQKRALGLHRLWQCPQVLPAESAAGAGDAAGSGTGSCLAPQFLQNLALGARGFPHCEQFIVCNGLVMLRAMRSLLIIGWCALGIHRTKD